MRCTKTTFERSERKELITLFTYLPINLLKPNKMLTHINIVTKCKDEFKNASNPVIMSCMVWYGMVWYGVAGQGNSFGRKYFLYTSDVITEDTMNVKKKRSIKLWQIIR